MESNHIVEGYSFYTEHDALLAQQECKKIEYLEQRIDYSRPDTVLKVYEKAVAERIFKTPVGLRYLKTMQEYLLERADINRDAVSPIPLLQSFDGEFREQTSPARKRIKPSEPKKEKFSAFTVSVLSNVVLVIAIIAMFFITLNADQPNILNYEKNLQNKYATWDQELTQREQVVREKELELKIQAK